MRLTRFPLSTISLKPSADDDIRRCTRVLEMVHYLHRAGYQKLRVVPFIHDIGAWRCPITYTDNLRADVNDHRLIIDYHVAPQHSSASDDSYFDWEDAKGSNARQLATLFIKRFSEIVARGAGDDWAYAGWYTAMLGYAQSTGKVPVVWGSAPDKCFIPPPPPQEGPVRSR